MTSSALSSTWPESPTSLSPPREGRAAAPAPRPGATASAPALRLRLLTFSTLFPSASRPSHGVFVENRLRHLVAGGEAEATVLAPVPWFPSRSPRFGEWARHAAAPRLETRHGLAVHHPRYLAIPRVGMSAAPFLLYDAAARALTRMVEEGLRFDAIDAHYLYPDGVAAVWLGRRFGKPVVITARGSDTSLLPRYAVPGRLIREVAIAGADALISVSAGLAEGLHALGAPREKVTVLRNGVDLGAFAPRDRAAARAALGLGEGPVLLSVGLLIERKGHHHVIAALRDLPGHTLLIAGEGPERGALLALAERCGVGDRVLLVGPQPHGRLPEFYSAADALVLASSREGWANVLLEAMACGTPVVASPAWGSREAVSSPAAGLVLDETTPEAIAAGVRRLLAAPPSRADTRAYAERFGWDETTAGQVSLFRRVLGQTG
ncbi:glycosyltransferase family 4 protein [Roseomonas nepalensis]|uniref:Glycosyltransferase family 4 protein n=1 Tax=Muricoccus nepalensis TaxID=1854500 RepID=A0A502GJD7_9PROT|nr:glycosyltransferase family 4 protein [Roseomonas nepalensis]TPG61076.1 glycosyltransferase family 4 protein [Roseomonas nepalensis]